MTTERTEERKNRFNGESVMLTPEEAKRHDQIFLDELQATIDDQESGITGHSKHWQKMRDNLDWFMKNKKVKTKAEKIAERLLYENNNAESIN